MMVMGHGEGATSECYWYYNKTLLSSERSILLSCSIIPSFLLVWALRLSLFLPVPQVLTLSLLVWTKVVWVQFPWRHLLVWEVSFSFWVHPSSLQEYVKRVRLVFSLVGVVRRIKCYEIVEMWLDRHIISLFIYLCFLIVICI